MQGQINPVLCNDNLKTALSLSTSSQERVFAGGSKWEGRLDNSWIIFAVSLLVTQRTKATIYLCVSTGNCWG